MKRITVTLTEDQNKALIDALEQQIGHLEDQSETTEDVDQIAFLIRLQNTLVSK